MVAVVLRLLVAGPPGLDIYVGHTQPGYLGLAVINPQAMAIRDLSADQRAVVKKADLFSLGQSFCATMTSEREVSPQTSGQLQAFGACVSPSEVLMRFTLTPRELQHTRQRALVTFLACASQAHGQSSVHDGLHINVIFADWSACNIAPRCWLHTTQTTHHSSCCSGHPCFLSSIRRPAVRRPPAQRPRILWYILRHHFWSGQGS